MRAQDWVNLILGLAAIVAGGTGAAAHYRLNGHQLLSSFYAHRQLTGRPGPARPSGPAQPPRP